jgi:hypothetical protein
MNHHFLEHNWWISGFFGLEQQYQAKFDSIWKKQLEKVMDDPKSDGFVMVQNATITC